MNRKVLITIMIIIAAVALTYMIMPDLIVGPFDDGVLAVLAVVAEVVLYIVQAVQKSAESRTNFNNTDHQEYYQDNEFNHDSRDHEEEFQFFAGCNDWEQVKARYRELMKIYHPDAGGHEEVSKKINAEYNILKKKFGH